MDDRTIRVRGLPVHIPKNRLSDKLKIHFLRKKNGGGDISSITFSETTPGVALITFTDCGVAQRVISHGFQTLSVNDIQYTMTLSMLQKEMDPDEIFIDITVKVDYSKLPGGKKALSDILVNFPGLKMNFQPSDDLCILNGHYSKVQALIKYMLSVMNSNSTPDIQLPRSEVLSDQKKYHSTKRQVKSQSENEFAEKFAKCCSSESSHIPPHQASSTNHSVASRAGKAGTSQEDCSMIIDTDIFRYLHHCSKEFKSILDRHGVEVLDVTTKDITTLYLQLQSEVDGDVECMQRAHVELGSLYEKTEAQLRKVSLPKGGLPIQGLQQALDVVLQTFPDLMINEDKVNVYLVGSGTDVSEAKQFLMDIETPTEEHVRDQFNLSNTFVQSSGTVSLSYMPEAQVDQHHRNRGAEEKMDTNFEMVVSSDKSKGTFRSSWGEVKHLEADLMYPLLITKPNEKEHLSLDCRPVSEIMSLKVQSSLSDYEPEDFKPVIEIGEGTPFMRNEPASINRLTTPSFSHLNRAKYAANSGKLQSNSLDFVPTSVHNVAPTNSVEQSKSGSTVRKVNSFSEPVRSKGNGKTDHLYLQGQMPSCNSSSQKPVRCLETSIFSVDVEVPTTKWLYLKQFYLPEIEDLTSDLQMNEDNARGKETILNLRGADAANVGKTQQGLKELVSKACEDFHTEELLKAHVGVSDSKTVEYLCSVVKDTFEKVLILQMTRSIFILGPKLDCQDAMVALKELFVDGSEGEEPTPSESPVFKLQQETKQDEDFSKGMATETLAARTNKENALSAALCLWCQGKVNPHCRMCRHSDSIDVQSSHNKHSEVNQREDKPVGRTVEKSALLCVCGSTESVTLMACGVNLCSNFEEEVHSKCRVCTKPEESVSGIRGTMSFTEMSVSLAGYPRDMTQKITYTIPDGIQGADHPNPGSPFKGDTFHAYLPMNETTHKLVSSLEQAFHQGITFCVRATDSGDKVTWGRAIPHKTNTEGGKSKNGFPDSSYLKCLSEALTSQLVKESKHLE